MCGGHDDDQFYLLGRRGGVHDHNGAPTVRNFVIPGDFHDWGTTLNLPFDSSRVGGNTINSKP